MTPPAPAANPTKPRQPKNTVYIARLVVKVPIDMANAESLGNAIKAVAGMGAGLPEGSAVEHTAKPNFGRA